MKHRVSLKKIILQKYYFKMNSTTIFNPIFEFVTFSTIHKIYHYQHIKYFRSTCMVITKRNLYLMTKKKECLIKALNYTKNNFLLVKNTLIFYYCLLIIRLFGVTAHSYYELKSAGSICDQWLSILN